MPQQIINNGSFDNDPSAEKIRTAFDKVNENFAEVYAMGGGGGTSNLSLTATPTSHIISNTNGTGFTTPLADAINAGLMLPSEKTKVAAIDQAVSTVEKSTWNGKQDSLVSGTNIKTINGNSVLGSGNLVITNTAFRHIFAFDSSFAASTSWFAPNRESATLYSINFLAGAVYNGTSILEPRCVKLQIPYNCKLKKAQVVYNTLGTSVDVRIIYFEYVSAIVNQITIASTTLATSVINNRVTFSTLDLTSTLNANGYVTFAIFDNNIATGVMRNVQIILDFE
jgi:hypothetical protein